MAGKIAGSEYVALILGVAGFFIGGNTYEKVKNGQEPPNG
jgi:hypothetical protein